MAARPESIQIRAWVFSIVLLFIGAASALYAIATVSPPVGQPFQIHWILLAAGFVAAEAVPAHVDLRSQSQRLTFTEAPLTFGLLLADPTDLILVRIAVGIGVVFFMRDLDPVKIVYNLASFACQAAAAVLVFSAVLGSGDAVGIQGWLAGIVAAVAAYLTTALAVTCIMKIVGSSMDLRSQIEVVLVGLLASVAGSFTALAAAGSLWNDRNAWIPMLFIVSALTYFGTSFLRLRERNQAVARLNDFTAALVFDKSLDELGRAVVTGLNDLLEAQRTLLLLRSARATSVYEAAVGAGTKRTMVDIADSEWAATVAVASAQVNGWPQGHLAGQQIETDDVMVRLLGQAGDGAILLVDGRRTQSRTFDEGDMRVLATAAGHAGTAIRNARLVDELRQEADRRAFQALHDEVTGLPNARGLGEQLEPALAEGTAMALVTVRVGSLREVNETLGRAMGDVLLREVSDRLAELSGADSVAKTATDEFSVVRVGGHFVGDDLASKVVAAFEQPFQCEGVALAVSAGVGVALAPAHGREIDILLRRAGLAASRSQVEGSKVSIWAEDRDPYDPQRLAIAAELRDGISEGQLDVLFQPQIDSRTGLVTGAEALVRWDHPRLGRLAPDQFIAAAEYTGAIDALTAHVLEVAVRRCVDWRLRGWDFDVAVNLSARNLADRNFASTVQRILSDAQLDASHLTLELTESIVMTEAEVAMGTLEDLARLGLTLSIDDFGTGFSSLAHLRRLPVSEIKIDKSFVFDLVTNQSDQTIVRAMIDLGRNLGLRVVIEGVETVEVRQRLLEMGADRIQGYLLSRPTSPDGFEQWVADRPVRAVGGPASPGDLEPRRDAVGGAEILRRERLERMALRDAPEDRN